MNFFESILGGNNINGINSVNGVNAIYGVYGRNAMNGVYSDISLSLVRFLWGLGL